MSIVQAVLILAGLVYGVLLFRTFPLRHFPSDSQRLRSDNGAVAFSPVLIAVMPTADPKVPPSGQWPFLQAYSAKVFRPDKPWHEKDCSFHGISVNCTYTLNPADFATADALYIHIPTHKGRQFTKHHPRQVRFGVTLESSTYYPWIDQPDYMCQFDAEASYRSCSQVQNTFHWEFHVNKETGDSLLHSTPLPYEQKEHAVVYLNSNCNTLSARAEVMKQWLELGTRGKAKVAVHSYGNCDRNRQMPANTTKAQLFHKYTFCVAMENSVAYDYITEKVWDVLAAGCVPIYLGSPTILQHVPEPGSVIVYGPGGNASSVAELDALVHRIGSDKELYETMLVWKHKPLEQLSAGYQRYAELSEASNECNMCIYILNRRMQPELPVRATTCLWNQSWMAAARKKPAPTHLAC